ncbi:tetratricopeptide repeat protein [soil metagenome]
MATRTSTAVAALVAGAVLLVIAATGWVGSAGSDTPADTNVGRGGSAVPDASTGDDALTQSIRAAQQRLEVEPEDFETWAVLGSAYVEQARISADPSYYPRAEGALERSLELSEDGNFLAMTGLGALSNARHDFAEAADWARRAQEINPAGPTSWGVLADALHQLGDYEGATAAVQRMLDLRPGIPSFSRASYDFEIHGRFDEARQALELGLTNASSASDIAFLRTYLGHLAFSQGDLDGAAENYQVGLERVPDEPTLLIGQARVAAARGEQDAALEGYQQVVSARPLPEYLVEYGEYLESLGRTEEADEQFALFEVTQQLFEANGVEDSLTVALVEANRGDPAEAVRAGEAEYELRQNVDSADALAWALHSAGRDAEALPYAEEATSIGGRNASFLYHRGVIEAALGDDDAAREHLEAALDTNPYFSPLHAPKAKEALDALGGPR